MMLELDNQRRVQPPSQDPGEPGGPASANATAVRRSFSEGGSSTSALRPSTRSGRPERIEGRQAQGGVSPSNHEVRPLVNTPAGATRNGEISPDGRWLAYESGEGTQYDIYVRPFPDVNSGRWQVSAGGGTRPLWARNDQELFYLAPSGALMSVRVERGATFTVATPRKLFEGPYYVEPAYYGRTYDVSPDGRRFLMIKPVGDQTAAAVNLIVVQNWFEELKRLVPTN